ncbi:hypothetical protein Tco_0139118 [Tanacetum coccineum]
MHKDSKNPIFQISVDILSNTNSSKHFTASANVPAIYLQQFWKTIIRTICVINLGGANSYPFAQPCLTGKTSAVTNQTPSSGKIVGESSLQPNVDHQSLKCLKFVPKGESVEVFGMAIPDPLIIEAIQQSSYYPKYLKMVAENTKKTPQGSASMQPATKRSYTQKASRDHHTIQTNQAAPSSDKENVPSIRPFLPQDVGHLLDDDIRGSSSEATPKLHEEVGKWGGKGIGRLSIPGHQTLKKAHEALAGPDPEPMNEDQTGSDSGKLHVSLAGPNPEHMEPTQSDCCPSQMSTSSEPTITWSDPPPINPEADNNHQQLSLKSLYSRPLAAKILERHTEDLIEKYSVLPGPESVKNQESEKSPKEIIKAKKEQGEEKQDSTYSIRSTDEVDIEEFDLKSALISHMNTEETRERPQRRQHDSDDEDKTKDEMKALRAGSTRVEQPKRRRSDSAASGSAKPPPKADDQSQTKPREECLEICKTLDNAQIPQGVDHYVVLSRVPERERPATTEPQNGQSPNDFLPEPEHNWANAYATTYKVPEENKLQKEDVHIGVHSSNVSADEQVTKSEKLPYPYPSSKALRYLDFGLEELVPSLWVESEREYDISAVYGITHWWFRRKEFYINKHSESSDREAVRSQMRILKYKISEKDFKNLHPNDFEDLFPSQYSRKAQPSAQDRQDQSSHSSQHVDKKPGDQESVWGGLHSDGTLTRVMEKLDQMVKDFHLFEYNKGMETRKWSEDDKRRSKDFITAIEKRLQIKRIYRSLESFVGGRIRDIDYRLINRTT